MKKHSVVLLGLGQIGMGYDLQCHNQDTCMTHARAFYINADFELKAGYDLDDNKVKEFIENYHIFASSHLHELPKADIAVICTPTATHADIFEKAIYQIAPKVVLLEKPIAYSIEDIQKIISLAQKNNIKIFMNYIRRAEPGVNKIKSMLDSGILGQYFTGTCFYSKEWLHNASHFVDLLSYWLGRILHISLVESKTNPASPKDAYVDAKVFFEKGEVTFVSLTKNHKVSNYHKLEIFSSSTHIIYDQGGRNIIFNKKYTKNNSDYEMIESDFLHYQKHIVSELAKFLKAESQYDIRLSDGVQSAQMISIMQQCIPNS